MRTCYLYNSNMGFFRALGRAIGRVVENVGDVIGSTTISDLGWKIQDACAEKVVSEKSYDKKEANIYTTDRLNEILVSFSEGYLQNATFYEKECIRLVEEYYDKLIGIIENAPGGAYSAANLKALKNGKKRIAKTITGGIREPLAKRMSLDDSECLNILKMDAGAEKKNAMKNFTQKVTKEALENLANNVRESLNDQTEDIQDYLNSISEEQAKTMQALKERFDKMVNDNELEQGDKEKNCVLPVFIVDISDCVCQILK